MTTRSKETRIKRLEHQQGRALNNPQAYHNLELRIQTLKNTARK